LDAANTPTVETAATAMITTLNMLFIEAPSWERISKDHDTP
jgi:hypothetical protein